MAALGDHGRGGIYLCWMDCQLLRSARAQNMQPAPEAQVPMARSSFLRGLLTNLSNPKSLIYLGSVFSMFVGDNIGTGMRWGFVPDDRHRDRRLVQPGGDDFLAASDALQLPAFSQMDRQAGERVVYRFRFAPDLYPLTPVVLGLLDIVHSQLKDWLTSKTQFAAFTTGLLLNVDGRVRSTSFAGWPTC